MELAQDLAVPAPVAARPAPVAAAEEWAGAVELEETRLAQVEQELGNQRVGGRVPEEHYPADHMCPVRALLAAWAQVRALVAELVLGQDQVAQVAVPDLDPGWAVQAAELVLDPGRAVQAAVPAAGHGEEPARAAARAKTKSMES